MDVTLDPDTAYPELILSKDGKQVHHGNIKQNIPNYPKRFDSCLDVLGKEGFSSGKLYFEVQVKGKAEWDLGVARESINRKGKVRLSPEDGCWTLVLRNENQYKACENPCVSLSQRETLEKVGVFVDYEEGLVFFMTWSPALISTLSLVSLSLTNSIHSSAHVIMMKLKTQTHWSFHLSFQINEYAYPTKHEALDLKD